MYSCHDVFIGSHQLRAPGFTFLSFNLFTVEARCVFFSFFFIFCNTHHLKRVLEEGAVSFLLQHANDDFTKQNWNFI